MKLKVITSGNTVLKLTSEHTFSREDTLEINGRNVPVAVFKDHTATKAWHRFIPFYSIGTNHTAERYYGKNLGLVKFTNNSESEESEWTLVEIRKIE
ncbi:MAG: hypothetical protein DIU61_017180 [Bacteroidota bacterium]|jgi:hypothetical protein|nr:MAG: hypothetical protein DIU61_19520 [Bacteroidota bacterium]